MNRWMVLRILVLGGGFCWAVWSLRETPSVDLLADAPLTLLPPGSAPPPRSGDAMAVTTALQQAAQGVTACGLHGQLKLKLGMGLEQAEWRGSIVENHACLEQALWGAAWPALTAPMELEWAVP